MKYHMEHKVEPVYEEQNAFSPSKLVPFSSNTHRLEYLMLSEPHKAEPLSTVKSLRTNPIVLPDESVNPRLARLLSEIDVGKELIVALVNLNVQAMLKVWSSSIKKNPVDHLYEDSDVESMSDGHNNATAYGFKDIFDEPVVDWARYAHTMRFWDPGGENRVICVCHHLLGPREKKYLFIKVEGHQLLFTRPKENEVEAWKFGKIKPSSAPYFYELDFDVAKRENKIWDAGGEISIDCSEMVINVTSGNSFPIFQSIIAVIALCSSLNNFDSLDIRV